MCAAESLMEITDALKEITLAHIEGVQFDMEDIILNDGPEAHLKFSLFLIQCQFKKHMNLVSRYEKDGKINHNLKKRCLIYAKRDAMEWLMQEGHSLIDRSTAVLFNEAKETGWFKSDYFSWDQIEDLVAGIVDSSEDDTSQHFAWLTFANKIVPAAKAFDIEPGLLMTSASQVRKMRFQLVPGFNDLQSRMEAKQISPEEGEATLRWMLEMSANPTVSSARMKEQVNEWRGVADKVIEPVKGMSCIMHDGTIVYVVATDNRVTARLVENSLRGKVDFITGGSRPLLDFVGGMLNINMSAYIEKEMGRIKDEHSQNND